jgi:hypothetical protein
MRNTNNNPEPNLSRRVQQGTNAVDPHRIATEFTKLIIKLRWIGCDDKAELLERQLAMVAPREFAFFEPLDTD